MVICEGLAFYLYAESICIISLRWEIWAHNTSLTTPHQVKIVAGHVFVCKGYQFCVFLRFFYWILEIFRQSGIFLFFILFIIYLLPGPENLLDGRLSHICILFNFTISCIWSKPRIYLSVKFTVKLPNWKIKNKIHFCYFYLINT